MNKIKTMEILLGIAKQFKITKSISSKQRIIVDFNICGGFAVFKQLVNDCDFIGTIEKRLTLERQ